MVMLGLPRLAAGVNLQTLNAAAECGRDRRTTGKRAARYCAARQGGAAGMPLDCLRPEPHTLSEPREGADIHINFTDIAVAP